MSRYTQNDRPIRIDSPLGEDGLLVDAFEGEEGLSRPFEFRLDCRSPEAQVEPAKLIGQPVTLGVDRADGSGETRFFNGLVASFENRGLADRGHHLYGMVVRPRLWLMGQTSDCRIFQDDGQTVLDIARTLFDEAGVRDVEVKVDRPPPPRGYVVQYNETDLAFVGRLLEDEGLFYYFRHEDGRHVLVIGDSPNAWADCAEASVSFAEPLSGGRSRDRITAWAHQYQLCPGRWAHADYNFETPSADLLADASGGGVPVASKLERYEYPGVHADKSAGDHRAKLRLEEAAGAFDEVRGASVIESLSPGAAFDVAEHHSAAEEGRRYVVTEVRHRGDQRGAFDVARNGAPAAQTPYRNAFVAIPAQVRYRPPRRTPKPRIAGPQTAVVVGPSGEEVWTDKYGRVRVQFHWDRYGRRDERSSCWVRCAYPSAGGGWGLLQIPRIGHEVVVEFLNGDPDCPLITGGVYNAEKLPPRSAAKDAADRGDVPASKMMFTLRSQSLGHGGGYNEITMDDTGGSEVLFVRAERDELHVVKHDRKDQVEHDETREVDGQQKVTVGKDSTHKTTGVHSHGAREITLTAQTKLTLKCGGSTIELTPASITINGPIVKIN